MARVINLTTHKDKRGNLTVLEREIPFAVRRAYWIWGNNDNCTRGGHSHRKNMQALVCVSGSCVVEVRQDGGREADYVLDSPDCCLLLEPEDWHLMKDFTRDCVLLVFASESYEPNDYVGQEEI